MLADVDLDPRDNQGRDIFALIEEEQERSSGFEEEKRARVARKSDKCMEILRTAIETRSQNEPRVPEIVPR